MEVILGLFDGKESPIRKTQNRILLIYITVRWSEVSGTQLLFENFYPLDIQSSIQWFHLSQDLIQ